SFSNDPASHRLYTLSLHDALPIHLTLVLGYETGVEGQRLCRLGGAGGAGVAVGRVVAERLVEERPVEGILDVGGQLPVLLRVGVDRKSTRLNSSHVKISYAVFCLK